MTAVSLLTNALDGVNFTEHKFSIFLKKSYNYPILHYKSIATDEAYAGEPTTLLGYQYIFNAD